MTRTVPADFIGKETVCYVLLALLSKNAQNRIAELLKGLSAELPGVLWTMPPEQMHITLCAIVQLKPYTQDKHYLYELHKEQYENIPAQILSSMPKFTVTLDLLECSSQAVIIKSSDASSFNSIRSRLTKSMPFPAETSAPPNIIHSSIARYTKAVNLEDVQAVIARHQIHIEEEITEFKLITTGILPLQKYDVLRTYPLV
jgi:hypothetical protein